MLIYRQWKYIRSYLSWLSTKAIFSGLGRHRLSARRKAGASKQPYDMTDMRASAKAADQSVFSRLIRKIVDVTSSMRALLDRKKFGALFGSAGPVLIAFPSLVFLVGLAIFWLMEAGEEKKRMDDLELLNVEAMADRLALGYRPARGRGQENSVSEDSETEKEQRYFSWMSAAELAKITERGTEIWLSDAAGRVVASLPMRPEIIGDGLHEQLSGIEKLMLFGADAGTLRSSLDGHQILVALRLLPGEMGAMTLIHPLAPVQAAWRRQNTVKLAMFIFACLSIGIINAGMLAHKSRAARSRQYYAATRQRIDGALSRGRSALFDWDLSRGRIYWSSSFYDMLGLAPREDMIGFSEMADLICDPDFDLYDLARELADLNSGSFDRVFQLRHVAGGAIWVRARAEIQHIPDNHDDNGASGLHLVGILVDISEQQKLAERSQLADIRLRDAIESLNEAFVLWDARQQIIVSNSRYQQLEDMLQRILPLAGEATEGMDTERRLEVPLADGRWLQISERKTRDGGFVCVGTDITELKRQEQKVNDSRRRLTNTISELKHSRQQLIVRAKEKEELAEKLSEEKSRAEEANQIKSQFLANMSHELRTPLNAIIGFSEIMTNQLFGKLGSERYMEYSQDIYESGRYLLSFIDDILQMSKIEAGQVKLRRETVNISEIAADVWRLVKPEADEKSIEYHCSCDQSLSLMADRRAIKQIVLNLVTNAVKFSPEGGLVTFTGEHKGRKLSIAIEDNGIGINKDDISKLAKPFVQLDDQPGSLHQGSGLGLAIARRLVELHGGMIQIDSTPGQGTKVTIIFPAKARAGAVKSAKRPAVSAKKRPRDSKVQN